MGEIPGTCLDDVPEFVYVNAPTFLKVAPCDFEFLCQFLSAFLSGALLTAIPGIAAQLVLIPLILVALKNAKMMD